MSIHAKKKKKKKDRKVGIEISEATAFIRQVHARWCHNVLRWSKRRAFIEAHGSLTLLAHVYQLAPKSTIEEQQLHCAQE